MTARKLAAPATKKAAPRPTKPAANKPANSKKASSPAYESLVEALVAEHDSIERAAMFGMPCLKVNGTSFAGSFDAGVVFKLRPPEHTQALSLAGAELFDPSGSGRAMKEWVVVPLAHRRQWAALAAASIAYVTES